MHINECARSLLVCVKEYLNMKYDSQYIEKEVSFKNNGGNKQHDKYQK